MIENEASLRQAWLLVMNFYKTKVFITSLTLSSTAFSQLSNDLKPNKDEAKEVAEEALKPLVNSPKREALLKLAAAADLNNQNFLKKLAAGEVKPWQELINNREQMQQQVAELAANYNKFLQAEDPALVQQAAGELRRLLNLIGPYLQYADYLRSDQSITDEEAKFLEDTQLADKGPAALPADLKEDAPTIKLFGPSSFYTLLHLPIPISLKAKPGSTIYLTTGTGGGFSNGLSMQVLKADDNGNVSTFWKSPGDSIGPGTLLITSPEAINHISVKVTVVQPKLIKIPDIAEVKQLGNSATNALSK